MGRRPAFEEVEGLGGGPSTHRACERGAQNLSACVYPPHGGRKHEFAKLQAIMQPSLGVAAHDKRHTALLGGKTSLPGRPSRVLGARVPQLLSRRLVI
jgi:hypothetical protein